MSPKEHRTMSLKFLALLPAVFAIACGAAGPALPADDDALDSSSEKLSAGGDWEIDDASHSQMESFGSISYDDAGDSCAGGFTDGAEKLSALVKDKFSDAVSSVEGYSCRDNTAKPGSLSIHAMGRAIDVMVNDQGGAGGTRVANFLLMNGDLLGVQLIIWNKTKCNLSRKQCGEYTGPNPHTDHVHAEITDAAASLNAPFYQGTALRDGTAAEAGGKGDTGGSDTGGSDNGKDPGCRSKTIDKTVEKGVCVQSASNDKWYQCTGSIWRFATETSGPAGDCTEAFPLQ
jgi:hypothetical protein